MAVSALTSLLESIQHVPTTAYLYKGIDKNDLEEKVTLCLKKMKYFDSKFSDDEWIKIDEEKIRVLASELEYSFDALRFREFELGNTPESLQTILWESVMELFGGIGSYDGSESSSSAGFPERRLGKFSQSLKEIHEHIDSMSKRLLDLESDSLALHVSADDEAAEQLPKSDDSGSSSTPASMAISALTILLESIERVPTDASLFRNSNKNYVQKRVTLFLKTLKHLDTKFFDDEGMKIGKEKIRVLASELKSYFEEKRFGSKTYISLQAIAEEINSMSQHLLKLETSSLAPHVSPDHEAAEQLPKFDDSGSSSSASSEEATKQMSKFGNSGSFSLGSLPSDSKVFSSVGLKESLKHFLKQLTGLSKKLERVGIVGMAGIGKTTLARIIFEDPCIIQYFDILAWVKTSQSHTKSDLLLQLLKCIDQQKNYDIHGQTETSLEEDLYRSLKHKRYLIVVDDLWSVEGYNEIKRSFPDDSTGSRILFTSRQSNVIEGLNCKEVHQMSLLDDETSWDLLQKTVFGIDTCPPNLVETGKQIAKKCQGLPLAVVVVAGILLKMSKKLESWKVIAMSFKSLVLSSTHPCQQMFALSYKHLPFHLKPCFIYMGAFPGGSFEIQSQVLTRLWIAEGFVTPMGSENMEQAADKYLKDLIDRNLVLAASKRSNGNVKTCRLHDLLLEFCVMQARKFKFLEVIKDSRKDSGGDAEIKNYDKEDIDNRPSRFIFNCRYSRFFINIPPQSEARTALFMVRSEVPGIVLYNLDFRKLVVLDMIPLRFNSFPEEQVSKLTLLNYLALTVSFELPKTVFRLLRLQTLIVNDSRFQSDTTAVLPLQFWESLYLRHMQLQVANYLPPPDDELIVKQMNFLLTLSKVTLSSFVTPESFSCIPNVTKLGVCETIEDFSANDLWNRFFENLVLLSHLETLKVYCLQMNNCSPRVLPIPSSNAFPENLRKMTLTRSHMHWEKMKILGELPNLEVLKLRNYAFQGPEWETQGGGFQRLSYLSIEYTDLTHWSLEEDDCFPRLQQLVLKFCQLLEEIPEQIGDISSLSYMELHYCSNIAEESVKYIQQQQKDSCNDIEVRIRTKVKMQSSSPQKSNAFNSKKRKKNSSEECRELL